MIEGCSRINDSQRAYALFLEIIKLDVNANVETYTSLIQVFYNSSNYDSYKN